ncbi:MAG: hypothetical protein Q4C69_12470 [Lachnoclostridium edouardi]|uniref:hypothetical protein n=1 Tax=Lachnoclostridium edouardi TaxID=1926283 RepID=UPI0026DD36C8|nr:hypothetical protein [Lachnoclostridium edouardi]MDO4279634.1 hypothetical protein [Lachnoclostridium edouardi]
MDEFDEIEMDSDISPMAIIPTKFTPYARVVDGNGNFISNVPGTHVSNYDTDKYAYFQWPTLTGDQYYTFVYTVAGSSSLPAPGTYGVTWSFMEANVSLTNIYTRVSVDDRADNVNSSSGNSENVSSTSSPIRGTANVTIGYDTVGVRFIAQFIRSKALDIMVPIDNAYSFTFSSQPGDTAVSPGIAGGSGSATDYIAGNTADLVEAQEETNGFLARIIQTISNQLEALWDQLAGEFTNLYNKMNTQHAEDLASRENQTEELNDNADKNTNLITGALEKLGNFLIEGLKSLFIPSDGFFKDWFDDMYQFFTDRLGFLMLPVDLLVRLLNLYLSAGSGFAGIPFPEFKWLDGTVIIPAQTVQFDFLQTDWGKNIQTKLYFVGNVIMIGALINLMHRKMEEVLRG